MDAEYRRDQDDCGERNRDLPIRDEELFDVSEGHLLSIWTDTARSRIGIRPRWTRSWPRIRWAALSGPRQMRCIGDDLDADADAHRKLIIGNAVPPAVVALRREIIRLRIVLHRREKAVQPLLFEPKPVDHLPQLGKVLPGSIPAMDVIDGVDRNAVPLQEPAYAGKDILQCGAWHVLQNGNRVDAVE